MNILMIGPGRDVKGGISSVVNQYYAAGLYDKVNLRYLSTMEDGSKFKKFLVALNALIWFCWFVNKADVVHVHMSRRASFFRKRYFIKIASLAHKKIVLHIHSGKFGEFYLKECDNTQKRHVREVFAIADKIIALSNEMKSSISVFCDETKIIVLENAVKLQPFIEKKNNRNVLFLGKLCHDKGSYDLLNAIPEVLEHIPDAHFYLGGNGDVKAILQIIKDNKLEKNVAYSGWVTGDKKTEMLRKCRVFVLPSYHEGMPMSLLEAMSYGCVVVTTNVGGIPQVIEDGKNGYLIIPGDVKELTRLLIYVLSDDKEQVQFNAYNSIKFRFDVDKNINKLVDVYRSI